MAEGNADQTEGADLEQRIAELEETIQRLAQERQTWFIRATYLEGEVERLEAKVAALLLEETHSGDGLE